MLECHIRRAMELVEDLRVYLVAAGKLTPGCASCGSPLPEVRARMGLAVGELDTITLRLRLGLGMGTEDRPT